MSRATLNEIQKLLRHSRASTAADCYVQSTPEGQRRAVETVREWAEKQIAEARAAQAIAAPHPGIR